MGKFTKPGVRKGWQISHREGTGVREQDGTRNGNGEEPRVGERQPGGGDTTGGKGTQTSDPEAPDGDAGSDGGTRPRHLPEPGGGLKGAEPPPSRSRGRPGRDARILGGEGCRREGRQAGRLAGKAERTPGSGVTDAALTWLVT